MYFQVMKHGVDSAVKWPLVNSQTEHLNAGSLGFQESRISKIREPKEFDLPLPPEPHRPRDLLSVPMCAMYWSSRYLRNRRETRILGEEWVSGDLPASEGINAFTEKGAQEALVRGETSRVTGRRQVMEMTHGCWHTLNGEAKGRRLLHSWTPGSKSWG